MFVCTHEHISGVRTCVCMYRTSMYVCMHVSMYNRTSMAQTPLEPLKDVRDKGSSRKGVLLITPDQEAYLFDFFIMKVCCLFSLKPAYRGDSNNYTHHTIINIKKKFFQKYPKYNNVKNEFGIAFVNEPSVFEPLKFYCMYVCMHAHTSKVRYILTYVCICHSMIILLGCQR